MSDPRNPSFDCVAGKHLHVDVVNEARDVVVGGWCLWCGTAAYDPDGITDDGKPIGFTPNYRIRIPDGFTRERTPS